MRCLIAIAAILFSLAGPASAADSWRATQVAGEVRVEIGHAPAVPLTVAMSLEQDALIETAASGSATLVRGEERITVAPNSRLRLPIDDASGITRVIEEVGRLFFQVGKKTTPHFRVETPLLAATVKGTSFTVTVDHKGANVEVNEGLVLVHNNTSADETYVAAGRTANVTSAEPMVLNLDHAPVPPSTLRLSSHDERLDLNSAPMADPNVAKRQRRTLRTGAGLVPQITFTAGRRDAQNERTTAVIDSTLLGIGVGILAAALAIVFIGTSRRPPGLIAVKAGSEVKNEQSQA